MNLLILKCVHGIAPSYLCDVLTPAASIRTRESRSTAENLYVPYVNCEAVFRVQGTGALELST